MPKKARIILEITYELPVENGYGVPGKTVTYDPNEMLTIDMTEAEKFGWIEFINMTEPDIKFVSSEVVD